MIIDFRRIYYYFVADLISWIASRCWTKPYYFYFTRSWGERGGGESTRRDTTRPTSSPNSRTFSPSTWQQPSTTWRNKPHSFAQRISRIVVRYIFFRKGSYIFACLVFVCMHLIRNGWRKNEITTGDKSRCGSCFTDCHLYNSIASKFVDQGTNKEGAWGETKLERSSYRTTRRLRESLSTHTRILLCNARLCSLSGLCSLLRYRLYTPMRCRSEPVWKSYKLGTSSAYFFLTVYSKKNTSNGGKRNRKIFDWGASTVSEATIPHSVLRQLSIILS